MADKWDAVVIGGGITGAGVLRDLSQRGLRVTLVEEGQALGCRTTANSSCLIHGGLRYLVYDRDTTEESCRDAGLLLEEFPQLLTRLPFLWPVYESDRFGIEAIESLLEVYDGLAQEKCGRPHLRLGPQDTLRLVPGLRTDSLTGSVCFDEWLVDPKALCQSVADSASSDRTRILRGRRAVGMVRDGNRIRGVFHVGAKGRMERVDASIVVNAAGPWVADVANMAGVRVPMRLRKGVHLVYKGRLAPYALVAPSEDRRRFVFLIPCREETLVGPTDTPFSGRPETARADDRDISYLLRSMRKVFPGLPGNFDSLRVGLRPVVGQFVPEAFLSRDFEVIDHEERHNVSGLVTVAGGKMTTFLSMARETAEIVMCRLGKAGPPPVKRRRGHLRRLLSAFAALWRAYAGHSLHRVRYGAREAALDEFRKHYEEHTAP